MGGVPDCVLSVSIRLYNERKYPDQVCRVRDIDCNNSCDEIYFAPKHMKPDLEAVYDSGLVVYILSWAVQLVKSPIHGVSNKSGGRHVAPGSAGSSPCPTRDFGAAW